MSNSLKTLRDFIQLLPENGATTVKQELVALAADVEQLLDIERKHVRLIAHLQKLSGALKERQRTLSNTVPSEPIVLGVHNDFITLVSTIDNFIEAVTADATPKARIEDALVIYNDLMKRVAQKP